MPFVFVLRPQLSEPPLANPSYNFRDCFSDDFHLRRPTIFLMGKCQICNIQEHKSALSQVLFYVTETNTALFISNISYC